MSNVVAMRLLFPLLLEKVLLGFMISAVRTTDLKDILEPRITAILLN